MSEPAGILVRAQDLEPGCWIEVEGHEYLSGAKVQSVREKVSGIEIELYLRRPIRIPAGCAMANYWIMKVPYDTQVRVSHLPLRPGGDTRPAHGNGHQQGRNP